MSEINPHNPFATIAALPGTEERILALQKRASAGLPLNDEDDAKADMRRGIKAERRQVNHQPKMSEEVMDQGEKCNTLHTPHCPCAKFPGILRWFREKAGYSQEGLARMVGLTRRMIIYYEQGDFEPVLGHLMKLGAALKISVAVLAGETAVKVNGCLDLTIPEQDEQDRWD